MKTLQFSPRRKEAPRASAPLLPQVGARSSAYLVRHPILDSRRAVFGYELLYRLPARPEPPPDASTPAAPVLADTILAVGLETLTDGRPAFVNVPKDLLLNGVPTLLPAEHVVVELTTEVLDDEQAVEACRALKTAGYRIALDDFLLTDATVELVPLADFIKIDFETLNDAVLRAQTLRDLRGASAALIAESIETSAQFDQATQEGFTYFQGFFFGQTVMRKASEIPPKQAACLQLLNALNKPDLSTDALEDIIKRDAMLSYRLLRTVSSGASTLAATAPTVRSIRLALMLLGRDRVRRWASLWVLAAMADPGRRVPTELVAMSTVRARCCELLDPSGADDGFLLGMCSLLDVILGQPLSSLVQLLPLEADTGRALCGHQNSRRGLLECVVAYERGEWETAYRLAEEAGIDPSMLPIAYQDALSWTRGLDGTAA